MNALLSTLTDPIGMGGDKVQQVRGKAQLQLLCFLVQIILYRFGNVEQVCRIGSCHGAKIGQWTATAI